MRKHLTRLAALAAAGTIVATGLAFTSGAAHAATPSCGNVCIDVFSDQFGSFHHPNFVMDVKGRSQSVGAPIILFRQSNSDPAEDFTVAEQGQVSDFFAAGMVSSALNLHYGCNFSVETGKCGNTGFPNDYAFEVEYAPYGMETGLCVGVGSIAGANTPVTLQPCGESSKTVWIVDTLDSCGINSLFHGGFPVINASSTNFSHPPVLTFPSGAFPTDNPRPQLKTSNLTGFSQPNGTCGGGGSVSGVSTDQLWAAKTGVLF